MDGLGQRRRQAGDGQSRVQVLRRAHMRKGSLYPATRPVPVRPGGDRLFWGHEGEFEGTPIDRNVLDGEFEGTPIGRNVLEHLGLDSDRASRCARRQTPALRPRELAWERAGNRNE